MFDLGLDSKLRACDLVKMRVRDICHGEHISPRATVMQQKTSRPVQFEITQSTHDAVNDWIKEAKRGHDDYLFPSRIMNHRTSELVSTHALWILGSPKLD